MFKGPLNSFLVESSKYNQPTIFNNREWFPKTIVHDHSECSQIILNAMKYFQEFIGQAQSYIIFYQSCTVQIINGSKRSRSYAYNTVTYGNCIQVCSKREHLRQKICRPDETFQPDSNPAEFSISFFVVHGFIKK